MPNVELNPELVALLDKVDDPVKRQSLQKEMEASMLRQSDYSRKMNEYQKAQKEHEEWYNNANAEFQRMQKQLREANDALAQYRNNPQPAEPQAGAAPTALDFDGGELGDSKVAAALKAALEEARAARAEAEAVKQAVIDHAVTKEYLDQYAPAQFDRYGTSVFKTMDVVNKAKEEFGINVSTGDVVKVAAKYKGSPDAFDLAYKDITAEAAKQRDIEAIRKQVEAEVAARYATGAVPLAGEGPMGANPLQTFLAGPKGDDGVPANVKADGTGRLAAAIAANLRAEGKY